MSENLPVNLELGLRSPSLPTNVDLEHKTNRDPTLVKALEAQNRLKPQGCQQKFCHIVIPKDWSEYFIIPGALTALGFGVFHALADSDNYLSFPSFAVGLICILAEVRIRQLWTVKTLDDAAEALHQNNTLLDRQVTQLDETTIRLREEIAALKKDLLKLTLENAQFKTENKKLSENLEDQETQLKSMRQARLRLKKDIQALKEAASEFREPAETLSKPVGYLKDISSLEEQLKALEETEEKEAQRHNARMNELKSSEATIETNP